MDVDPCGFLHGVMGTEYFTKYSWDKTFLIAVRSNRWTVSIFPSWLLLGLGGRQAFWKEACDWIKNTLGIFSVFKKCSRITLSLAHLSAVFFSYSTENNSAVSSTRSLLINDCICLIGVTLCVITFL